MTAAPSLAWADVAAVATASTMPVEKWRDPLPWLIEIADELSRLAGAKWVASATPRQGHRLDESHDDRCTRWTISRVRVDGGGLYVLPWASTNCQPVTHLLFVVQWPVCPDTEQPLAPRDLKHRRPWESIRLQRKISLAKRPSTAAKELHRHVLTPYEPLYSRQWGIRQRIARSMRENATLLDELVALGAVSWGRFGDEAERVDVGGVQFRIGQSTTSLRGGMLSRAKALAIARVLLEPDP